MEPVSEIPDATIGFSVKFSIFYILAQPSLQVPNWLTDEGQTLNIRMI
jgi:hypothetical protein